MSKMLNVCPFFCEVSGPRRAAAHPSTVLRSRGFDVRVLVEVCAAVRIKPMLPTSAPHFRCQLIQPPVICIGYSLGHFF